MSRIAILAFLAIATGAVCSKEKAVPTIGNLVCSETTIAGGSGDLMVVRHLVLKGSNAEIGQKLAEIARDRHGITGKGPVDVKQLAWLASSYPEQHARSLGAAKAFGLKPDAAPVDLGYNLSPPGCSVVYYPGTSVTNGHPMLSRNYDFPTGTYSQITGRPEVAGARSMTGDPYVIEMHPDMGYASLFICAYDLLGGAIDGVNEKGVAVALLADDISGDKQPRLGFGLSELNLPRFVLDTCATAKEARKKLAHMPYFYTFTPCHYMICDATGDSFVWESKADLSKRFTIDGKGKPQIVTNHLLGEYDANDLPSGNSFDRYRRLQEELGKTKTYSPVQVKENNFCVAVPKDMSDHATLWHSIYDLQSRTMQVSFYLGPNRRTKYFEFALGK